MKKHGFYSEIAYVIGLVSIAVGVVFATKADFGVSMVVAPAYLLYRWLNPSFGFFTFGMAEYCLQGVLILLTALLVRKFRLSFLFCFVTAVIYGFILDGLTLLLAFLPTAFLWLRIVYFVISVLLSGIGVALMFHTYLTPEAYEMIVKEVSEHYGIRIHRFKMVYDYISCAVGVIMSFCIFGWFHFVGISWGTVIITLVNGFLIGACSSFLEKHFEFRDALPWRDFFTKA